MSANNTAHESTGQLPAKPRPTSSLVYFAFGSNLSSTQMRQRCPLSRGISLGRLHNYSFQINTRGYANIVPSTTTTSVVYGVLWQLDSSEEKRLLDRYEGVASGCYKDVLLPVEILDRAERVVGIVWALVYVDPLRTSVGPPKKEYVGRMNLGIEEAKKEWGLPERYVRESMRRFIREQ